MQGLSKVYFDQFLLHLHMSVYQPVEFKVFVVVPEGVDKLLCNLEESHEEEKLENSENWEVEVNVDRVSVGWVSEGPSAFKQGVLIIQLLAANQAKYEEEVGSQGDHLRW